MREILFRGKPIGSDKWIYGNLQVYPMIAKCTHRDAYIETGGISRNIVIETIGQYTGLTDMDGKKIFEGDIVQERIDNKEFVGVVIYNVNSCRFIAINRADTLFDVLRPEMEVIGNIHDNPELLNAVQTFPAAGSRKSTE